MTAPDKILDEVLNAIYVSNKMNLAASQQGFSLIDLHTAIEGDQNMFKIIEDDAEILNLTTLNELREILEQLAIDGNLAKQEGSDNYFLTFRGRWTAYQSGYETTTNKNLRKENHLLQLKEDAVAASKKMNRLTLILIFGTVIPVLLNLSPIKENCFWILICSVLLGTAVGLLLSELERKKS